MTQELLKDIHVEIAKEIESNSKITLFFHVKPDGDALGSTLGFATFLKQRFPEKQIYISGLNLLEEFYFSDVFDSNEKKIILTDEMIKGSLGIVCDTSNVARIFNNKTNLCSKIIRIDHHPRVEEFGDII
jgi:phosphoesterase RecJ-like protein